VNEGYEWVCHKGGNVACSQIILDNPAAELAGQAEQPTVSWFTEHVKYRE